MIDPIGPKTHALVNYISTAGNNVVEISFASGTIIADGGLLPIFHVIKSGLTQVTRLNFTNFRDYHPLNFRGLIDIIARRDTPVKELYVCNSFENGGLAFLNALATPNSIKVFVIGCSRCVRPPMEHWCGQIQQFMKRRNILLALASAKIRRNSWAKLLSKDMMLLLRAFI